MVNNLKNIRVFLSSPSDVQFERNKVFKVANELNNNMSHALGRRVEIVGWEDVTPSISSYAQNVINEQVGDYDIFIGILSIRFGTATPKAGSGTEEEFNLAYDRYKQGKLADICFFFKTDGFTANDIDIEQFTLVKEFKRKISEIGCYRSDVKEDDFENNIRNLLTTILIDWDRISNRHLSDESKMNVPSQLDSIDEDIGYYDAIFSATEELEKSNLITNENTKAAQNFNNAMISVKSKLDSALSDRERNQIINDFSIDINLFNEIIENNIGTQNSHIIQSMSFLDVASKIYVEDFNYTAQDIKNMLHSLLEYCKITKNSIPAMEKFKESITKFPRATTKLNKSKKELILNLDKMIGHQNQSVRLLQSSYNKLKELL